MGIKIHGTRSKIRLKKMIVVSKETHSHLFSVKNIMALAKGSVITYDEVIESLIDSYNSFKLENKE